MKFLAAIFLFFFSALGSYGQISPEISKKIHTLQSLPEDTIKAKLYSDIFSDLMYEFPDTSMYYANSGMELAEKLKYNKGIATISNNMGVVYETWGEFQKALASYNKSVKYEKLMKNEIGEASSYINIGSINKNLGKYKNAIKYYKKGIAIYRKNKMFLEESIGYLNLGIIYDIQGIYDESYKYFLHALKLHEGRPKSYALGSIYMNLGVFVDNQGRNDEALKYYLKALDSFTGENSLSSVSNTYNNIGCVYEEKKNFDKALEYYRMALSINEKLGFKNGIALVYGNIGSIHKNRNNTDSAMYYYQKAVKIYEEIQYVDALATTYNSLGMLYGGMKNYPKAIEYLEKGFKIGMEIQNPAVIKNAAEELSIIYSNTGNYKLSLEYHIHYKNYSDSLDTEESIQEITQLQMQYEFDKERKVAEIEKEKTQKLHDAEIDSKNAKIDQQRTLTASFIVLFVLMCGFAFFIYRSYRHKRKMNMMLSQQKEEILEKNEELQQQKEEIQAQRDEIEAQRDLATSQRDQIIYQKKEITDSIHYARRIQTAVLPDKKLLNSFFAEAFILFRPRDIVSGDFYWFTRVDEKVLFAVADCTGHGVPGAFMSMLGVTLLDEIVTKQRIKNPAEILNRLRDNIIVALKQQEHESNNEKTGTLSAVRDGMDISLCLYDPASGELVFAGANSPGYLIPRKDSTAERLIVEIKPDKMPVGLYLKETTDFSFQTVNISKGDMLFLFSDGYADQFGGSDKKTGGRKFLNSRFKELLSEIAAKPADEQEKALNNALDNWMNPAGNHSISYEQVDDILVMGIKF
ncbi:MAG: hypothetical protein A2W91_14180 [Bacteroidetes bacterium GWF2_38_335]|nr:MAG: hypothetical protein A2W91_14180 [Bacteroidetes bacterium GWF2_38_335]OFY79389.1 MAG: hypothetical protein A2281_16975 [Bacteroidetes bacterium RIFOXYA12_FULL_38_20]HBS85653.1 hypothetical protein [Bacteroidales bacterium]